MSGDKKTQFPAIRLFEPALWDYKAAELVHMKLESVLHRRGQCNIMLTGGATAARVYKAWSREFDICSLENVSFYFGDERCVTPDHLESNYGMAMRTLFGTSMPLNCVVHRMEAESDDLEAAADRYAALLPEYIDILLLGVGEDGHIASLFPYSAAIHESRRRVLPIVGPKQPYRRLTISPPVIVQAHCTFVLAAGAARAEVLAEAIRMPCNIDALPARLVTSGTWLLDTAINSLTEHADHI
jgi:6-phosphogluconolactonase